METKAGDTLGSILDRVAAKYPNQEAIISGGQRITFDTLLDNLQLYS